MFASVGFAVYYAPGPLNSFFGFVKGMNENTHFQFQGQASLVSEGSTPERNKLILIGDQQTVRCIITTALREGEDQSISENLPSFQHETLGQTHH